MLPKSLHIRRIKQEIRKLAAIRRPSPRLNPVRESPTQLSSLSPCPPLFFCGQNNLRPTPHFRFTRQITRFPLSTSSIATGPSPSAYYSRAPVPDNTAENFTHVEDPNPNVESLRECSVGVDDRREDDGKGSSRSSRSALVLTCAEDGTCDVYLLVRAKDRPPELFGEVVDVITILEPQMVLLELCMFDSLEQNLKNLKVVNKVEVDPGDEFHVAYEEAMKYADKFIPSDRPEQVFLLRAWAKMPLWEKTKLIYASTLLSLIEELELRKVGSEKSKPSKKPVFTIKILSSFDVAVAGVAILSGIYFGWKK